MTPAVLNFVLDCGNDLSFGQMRWRYLLTQTKRKNSTIKNAL
jgi:hypothetical protein